MASKSLNEFEVQGSTKRGHDAPLAIHLGGFLCCFDTLLLFRPWYVLELA